MHFGVHDFDRGRSYARASHALLAHPCLAAASHLVRADGLLQIRVHDLAWAMRGRSPHKEHETGSTCTCWEAGIHEARSHLLMQP